MRNEQERDWQIKDRTPKHQRPGYQPPRGWMPLAMLAAAVVAGTWTGTWTGTARADSIYLQGLTLDGVVIQGITDTQITYQTSGGNQSSKDLSRVQRIHVDGESALNSAEDDFAAGKFSDAVDGYLKAARSSTHKWVQAYAASRLVEAANKSNRFDAAVSAYLTMLQLDPASAARVRPTIPQANSTYIDTALQQVGDVLTNTANLTDAQRIALLQFQIDLFNAKKDTKDSDQAAAQLDDILAKDPNNPLAARANARRKLQLAQQALDAQKFQDALNDIDAARTLFTDQTQQADALFIIAQAKQGLAGPGASPDTMKDVALAYMRVVADFKDLPGKPHIAEALLRTAQIEQQLKDNAAAEKLYHQITAQFPDDPAAATAKQSLSTLQPGS